MADWLFGVDISEHQGAVNWDLIVNSVHWAYAKATEGVGYRDSRWQRNRAEALRVGIPFGGYHFARADGSPDDARREADWFCDQGVGDLPLPPCLDMEDTSLDRNGTINWAKAFCDRVVERTGRRPLLVYWGKFFAAGSGEMAAMNDRRMADCLWWLPTYPTAQINPNPRLLQPPSTNGPRMWDAWQYTSSGRCAGIEGNVDMNVMSTEAFRRLSVGGFTPGKAYKMKACGISGESGLYRLVDEGNGNLKKQGIPSLDVLSALADVGLVDSASPDDAVWFSGPKADWFRSIPDANMYHSDMGALILAGKVMEFVKQSISDFGPAASVDPEVVKQAVAEALAKDNTDLMNDVFKRLSEAIGKAAQG